MMPIDYGLVIGVKMIRLLLMMLLPIVLLQQDQPKFGANFSCRG